MALVFALKEPTLNQGRVYVHGQESQITNTNCLCFLEKPRVGPPCAMALAVPPSPSLPGSSPSDPAVFFSSANY